MAEANTLRTFGPGRQEYGILDQALQAIAVNVWLGWLCNLSFLGVALLFVSWTAKTTIIAIVVLAAVVPVPSQFEPLGPLYATVGNFIMRRAAQYFSLQVQMTRSTEETLERLRSEGKPVVIGLEPHGVIPFSIFFCHAATAGFPLKDGRGLMSSILFMIPGMRQVYTSVAAAGADKKTMYGLLDRGISCVLIPGGVQEVPLLNKGTEKDLYLYLNKRLGFVKVALEKGAPVIPAFCFGILESYSWWIVPGKIAEQIGRTIGFMPMLYFGAMGVPLWIPRKVPLTVFVGEPIQGPALPRVPDGCKVGAELSEEQKTKLSSEIDEIVVATHAKYVEAMKKLFEENKKRLNMNDVTLHIE